MRGRPVIIRSPSPIIYRISIRTDMTVHNDGRPSPRFARPPAFHTVPVGRSFSACEPRSPCCRVYSPPRASCAAGRGHASLSIELDACHLAPSKHITQEAAEAQYRRESNHRY